MKISVQSMITLVFLYVPRNTEGSVLPSSFSGQCTNGKSFLAITGIHLFKISLMVVADTPKRQPKSKFGVFSLVLIQNNQNCVFYINTLNKLTQSVVGCPSHIRLASQTWPGLAAQYRTLFSVCYSPVEDSPPQTLQPQPLPVSSGSLPVSRTALGLATGSRGEG